MKARSDTERILDAYLAPEADQLADRVIDAALADIARTSQRRSWWPAGRSNRMNTYAKLIAAAAAVLVVAVVGYQLLPSGDDTGGQPTAQPSATTTSSPTATSSPSATSSATAAAVPPIVDGPLAAGTYRLRPFPSGTMTIDATVPGGGWLGGPPAAIGGPVGESNGPNGVAVAFLTPRPSTATRATGTRTAAAARPRRATSTLVRRSMTSPRRWPPHPTSPRRPSRRRSAGTRGSGWSCSSSRSVRVRHLGPCREPVLRVRRSGWRPVRAGRCQHVADHGRGRRGHAVDRCPDLVRRDEQRTPQRRPGDP